MKKNMKILRTAVGSLPSLGLIKELESYGIEVMGADSDKYSFGHHYLKDSFIIPNATNINFIYSIHDLIKNYDIKAILTGPIEEIKQLSLHRQFLEAEKKCTILIPDYSSVRKCIDKLSTYLWFHKYKIPYPKIYNHRNITFPCFIKPQFGSGSAGSFILNDKKEFDLYSKKPNMIIQEYIKGTEYSIDTLANKNGNPICIIPRIRIKTRGGLSIVSKTVYNEKIINYTKNILKTFKLFGPSCIQCFEDENGNIKFTEINNRFGGGAILSIKSCNRFIPSLIELINDNYMKVNDLLEFKKGVIMTRNFTEIFYEE